MTSGAKTRDDRGRRRTLGRLRALLLGGVLAALLAPAGAGALELPELMALLARVPSGQARFTERRYVKGLDAQLHSSGTLSFTAPDSFTRQTLQPRAERMAVEGNLLTLTRNGRSRTMVLDAAPEMEALVEAVRGTLTGNAQALQRHFRADLSGTLEQWTLDLVPLEPRVTALLARMQITGRRAELRTVEMRMADGDRSLMQIEPLPAAAAAQ